MTLVTAEHIAVLLFGFGVGTAVAVVVSFFVFRYVMRAQSEEDRRWRETWREETELREKQMIEAVTEARRYPAQVANIYGPISTSVNKLEGKLSELIKKMSIAETLVRRVEDLALQIGLFRDRLENLERWRREKDIPHE